MRIEKIAAVAFLMLATCSVSYCAVPAAANNDSSATTAADIKAVARQLAAADPIDVEAAVIKLALVPPESFPLIEAAAADPSLDPKAAAKLKTFIERQRPWQAPRLRIAQARQDRLAWIRTTALDAYDRAGSKDPKWDAAAREAVTLYSQGKSEVIGQARKAAEQAIKAGCNDPFILYLEGRFLEEGETRDLAAIDRIYETASDGMFKSQYPAYFRVKCYLYAFQSGWQLLESQAKPGEGVGLKEQVNLQTLIHRAQDEFPDMFDDNPPAELVLEAANQFIEFVPDDYHKLVYDVISRAWQKAAPDDPALLTFTGQFYVTYAWDARGSGIANTVTPQGWKDMGERLTTAAEDLTAAWEKDNTNAAAAVSMISVELGQGQGRNRMELWYRRAIEADPDNQKAVTAKMYYLAPKWHGTQQDMLIFARQLYETQNWRASFPLHLASVYDELITDKSDPQAFLAQPQVWQDIQAAYVPYLKALPDAGIRSSYCYRACRCGQWEAAKQQFKLLGDQAVAAQFGGEDAMKGFRDMAEKKGTEKQGTGPSPAIP